MMVAAIVTAAGRSLRMKVKNKLLLKLGGKPVLIRSIIPFEKSKIIRKIVITAPPGYVSIYWDLMKKHKIKKVKKIIPGGATRQDSVYRGLRALNGVDFVAVHDGARPLVTVSLLESLIKAAFKHGAVIPAVKVQDTVKAVDKNFFIEKTLERENISLVQTPQVFKYDLIMKAYESARRTGFKATDDSMLAEKICRVKVLVGDPRNIKITTKEDLVVAEAIINSI